MQLQRLVRLAVVGSLFAAGILGAASAQEPASGSATDTAAGTTREVNLSPDEQVKAADGILARIEGAASSVRKQLEKARQQKDVVKSLCLSDKLTQIDVAGRSASDRADALRQAAARKDNELATHEYTILVVLRERVDQLAVEANQCIGVEAGFVGDTKVTVDVDPNLPLEDPSEYPESPIIAVPPSCVSCFR